MTDVQFPIGTNVLYRDYSYETDFKNKGEIRDMQTSGGEIYFKIFDPVKKIEVVTASKNIRKIVGGRRKRHHRTKKAHKKRRHTRRH